MPDGECPRIACGNVIEVELRREILERRQIRVLRDEDAEEPRCRVADHVARSRGVVERLQRFFGTLVRNETDLMKELPLMSVAGEGQIVLSLVEPPTPLGSRVVHR